VVYSIYQKRKGMHYIFAINDIEAATSISPSWSRRQEKAMVPSGVLKMKSRKARSDGRHGPPGDPSSMTR